MLIKPVSLPRDLHLLETPVAYIRRSDVHLLTARRNAWQNTTLNHYKSTAPAFSTVFSARRSAETRRKPGTYFVIDEKPSLVFDLHGFSLVVIHLNASQRFESWKKPSAVANRDLPATGLEVFNMFAGSLYRESTSGWRVSNGEPDVILGIAESATLATSNGRKRVRLRRSEIKSGGEMIFRIQPSFEANAEHVERIIQELSHLTLQQYPVHEIYQWGSEYFCQKDATNLYLDELQRLVDQGHPVRLTSTSERPAFCSACLRWFDGIRPKAVE